MSNLPWLTILGLIPLVGALVVAFLPNAETAKRAALGVSLVTLLVGIAAASQFEIGSSEQFQLTEQYAWIPQFGVSYALGVDGIALALILLALVLTPVCLLAAWNDLDGEAVRHENGSGRRVQTYYALMLVLLTFMIGVFAATDVFLFYVFFEAMLIPVYFLIGSFGGAHRRYAAIKVLLFSLLGGLIMLVAVIALYFVGPGAGRRHCLPYICSNVSINQNSLFPGRIDRCLSQTSFSQQTPRMPLASPRVICPCHPRARLRCWSAWTPASIPPERWVWKKATRM